MVPYLHVTSRVDGHPLPDMLYRVGGRGFPTVAVLSAEGEVLAFHDYSNPRTIEGFNATIEKAREMQALKAKADKSDAEIEDIAAYYATQLAGSVTGTGEQTSEIIAKCDRCHGQAAGQSTMVVPVLQGQKQEYLLRVMKEYRDGKRGNSMMHKMSAGYSDALLSEIAEHYATQPR